MSKRNDAQYKIEKAADMVVSAIPSDTPHPGAFIKDVLLPQYGLSVSEAARRLGIDRAGFHGVLTGKYDVSRDLAYKLGALLHDHAADFLIQWQLRHDLDREKAKREAYRETIERVPAPAEA